MLSSDGKSHKAAGHLAQLSGISRLYVEATLPAVIFMNHKTKEPIWIKQRIK